MSLEIINLAISKGAKLYPNISGGKDGQAMTRVMINNKIPIEGLVHADLGRVEWLESAGMCRRLAEEAQAPLHIIKRADGRDMIDHWMARLKTLTYRACDLETREEINVHQAPFWSSSESRYCTSDMKRDPIDKFYRNCGYNLIISCEGIRSQESTKRAKKIPLEVRWRITNDYYTIRYSDIKTRKVITVKMTALEALECYNPKYRLALTWYPIFHFSTEDVWSTYGMSKHKLLQAQAEYSVTQKVPVWWQFHPAYVYGNERVSCVFCVLGCDNDLKVGAQHRPELLALMIGMEDEGQATFRNDFSLKQLQ